jgi:trk system potassium uptake protein TrkH
MQPRAVLHVIAVLLIVVAPAMGVSWAVSHAMGDTPAVQHAFLISAGVTAVAGLVLFLTTFAKVDLGRRDGFAVVTFGWIAVSLFGALPYYLTGVAASPIDAIFETMSGFTTTGASVLTDLESLPAGILFWRCLTQWLGGMGVLVLCVAILPFLGVGGMQIYKAEMPGPAKDRLTPRITSTAKLLWGVYLALTLVQALLLHLGGVDWLEAICHAFTTMSTGGFSTRSASVAGFDSLYVELVIVVFMFLAGVNFVLHYKALTGRPIAYLRDPEFRFYGAVWLVGILVLTINNLWATTFETIGLSLRAAVFQTTSIMTTTGYATEDFAKWEISSQFVLVLLMFLGGCAGSTAGGIKNVRAFIILKEMVRDIRRFIHPQGVFHVKLGKQPIAQDVIDPIVGFVLIFVLLFAGATFGMSFCTEDIATAFSSVVAALGNIGPGLSSVGPMAGFADIAPGGKILLTGCMLLGRLELYTVLVLFLPRFWQK